MTTYLTAREGPSPSFVFLYVAPSEKSVDTPVYLDITNVLKSLLTNAWRYDPLVVVWVDTDIVTF